LVGLGQAGQGLTSTPTKSGQVAGLTKVVKQEAKSTFKPTPKPTPKPTKGKKEKEEKQGFLADLPRILILTGIIFMIAMLINVYLKVKKKRKMV